MLGCLATTTCSRISIFDGSAEASARLWNGESELGDPTYRQGSRGVWLRVAGSFGHPQIRSAAKTPSTSRVAPSHATDFCLHASQPKHTAAATMSTSGRSKPAPLASRRGMPSSIHRSARASRLTEFQTDPLTVRPGPGLSVTGTRIDELLASRNLKRFHLQGPGPAVATRDQSPSRPSETA
jgi:hypothetical protein